MYDMTFVDPSMTSWSLLRQTWIVTNKVAEARLSRMGLTPEKAAVLWACRDYPGVLTPAEVSRLVFREAQSVAGLLNRMEKEGLVKRIPKRKGRPFTEIKATPKGEELCDPAVAVLKDVIQGLTSDLSPEERENFHNTLQKLRHKMFDRLHMELGHPPAFRTEDTIPLNW
jgi:DNA-binding MarR family transcriptional regulator